jgi:hypothetical protein
LCIATPSGWVAGGRPCVTPTALTLVCGGNAPCVVHSYRLQPAFEVVHVRASTTGSLLRGAAASWSLFCSLWPRPPTCWLVVIHLHYCSHSIQSYFLVVLRQFTDICVASCTPTTRYTTNSSAIIVQVPRLTRRHGIPRRARCQQATAFQPRSS